MYTPYLSVVVVVQLINQSARILHVHVYLCYNRDLPCLAFANVLAACSLSVVFKCVLCVVCVMEQDHGELGERESPIPQMQDDAGEPGRCSPVSNLSTATNMECLTDSADLQVCLTSRPGFLSTAWEPKNSQFLLK